MLVWVWLVVRRDGQYVFRARHDFSLIRQARAAYGDGYVSKRGGVGCGGFARYSGADFAIVNNFLVDCRTPRRSHTNHARSCSTYSELNATFDLIAVQVPYSCQTLQILHFTLNMWILPALGYIGVILGFAFLTLAIGKLLCSNIQFVIQRALLTRGTASGLYYLSELVEEHTVFAKKLLNRLIYGVIGLQTLLLLVDGFPIGLSALSIVSHVIYAQNLRRFPIVKLTDPLFLLSCGMCLS